eukprot:m.373362 g.373362  ORF g.373362 m.373362 type:complete len:94 (-) comp19997_c5_seq2:2811-3092(-)
MTVAVVGWSLAHTIPTTPQPPCGIILWRSGVAGVLWCELQSRELVQLCPGPFSRSHGAARSTGRLSGQWPVASDNISGSSSGSNSKQLGTGEQ